MKHCFLYLFHLFVVSNSCNLSSFGLALEFPSNKKQVCGQSECQQAQMQDVNRLDMQCLTFCFIFLLFCCLLRFLFPMSYFSPSEIYSSSSFPCVLVFHLSLAFYPSVYPSIPSSLSSHFQASALPPHRLKARTPGPSPQHTEGFLNERLCQTGYLNDHRSTFVHMLTRTCRHDSFKQFDQAHVAEKLRSPLR